VGYVFYSLSSLSITLSHQPHSPARQSCDPSRLCSIDKPVFLLFGVITVFLAICAAFLIVDFPEKSTFLTEDQKQWAMARIERDRADANPDPLTGRAL
jgi:hypothetical protein